MSDGQTPTDEQLVFGGDTMDSLIMTAEVEELAEEISNTTLSPKPDTSTGKIHQIRQESLEKDDTEVDDQQSDHGSAHESDRGSIITKSSSFCSATGDSGMANDSGAGTSSERDPQDFLHNEEFLSKDLHVFILSTAGKPIYTLHGNEDKLVTLYGVMQALVSVVQTNNDTLRCINVGEVTFVFLVKSPLILVAVSRAKRSVYQLQVLLNDVFNQIVSTITLSTLTKVYENRNNFDLRRLISGSERLIHHLLLNDVKTKGISNDSFTFLTHSVRILPISSSVRDNIVSAIQSNCSKIKNLVFAILVTKSKLIALVRMKKYVIHPADLRIIFNLVDSTESFKSSESWTPICLPKFDPNGFLHAHVSYLTENCDACLLLMSTERDVFFDLQEAKRKITEKLIKQNVITHLIEAIKGKSVNLRAIGLPEMRHFLYRCKTTSQLLCSEILPPYTIPVCFEQLESTYYELHQRIHNSGRPLKLLFEQRNTESLLVWVTQGYELFATFEPLIDKVAIITLVNKLLKWIKKEEDYLFILNAPSF